MRKPKPHETTSKVVDAGGALTPKTVLEGGVSSPPRFAADALISPALSDQVGQPHRVEQDVRRELLAQPSLHFASLVVRRIDNGVCLQGVLEADEELPDVCHIARRVSGVRDVLNRLVIAPRSGLPAKG